MASIPTRADQDIAMSNAREKMLYASLLCDAALMKEARGELDVAMEMQVYPSG